MARIGFFRLAFELDILIVKLRVNERGDMVEQGEPLGKVVCEKLHFAQSGIKAS